MRGVAVESGDRRPLKLVCDSTGTYGLGLRRKPLRQKPGGPQLHHQDDGQFYHTE